ncbi:MAG: acetate kinase [Bacilli bacterium]
MKIISVNAGSSSLKFTLFDMPDEKVIIEGYIEKIGLEDSFYTIKVNDEKIKKQQNIRNHEEAVSIVLEELINYKAIKSLEEIKGVGHRIVHGGKYTESIVTDEEEVAYLKSIIDLAPLHNPGSIIGIEAFRKELPNIKNVCVFDTAFHQTMPKEAYIYAVPYEWYEKYGVRKYGFHGTSHRFIADRIKEILNNDNLKIISCHLGNGGSICAIKNGKSIDTTMGFTPLAGIPMGTRSGDVDPSIIEYVMNKTNRSITEITEDLNIKSGFLGISGISNDSRDIEEGIKQGNQRCILAQNIYVRKVVSYIASYNNLLEGADVICFAGGIGEKGIDVRKRVLNNLKSIGVVLDEESNNNKGKEKLISSNDSKIKCYVIPTNEEVMIARDTYNITK